MVSREAFVLNQSRIKMRKKMFYTPKTPINHYSFTTGDGRESNKVASFETTLVQNYESPTNPLQG